MAESAVSFLVEKLRHWLTEEALNLPTEEAKLLGNVRQEVAHIKDDMDAMRAFLRDADANVNSSEQIKVWVRQVRELAYDIEDTLDEFMVHPGPRNGKGFIGTLCEEGIRFIKRLKDQHQLAPQIKEFRGRIRDLAKRRSAFAFIRRFDEGTSSSPNVASLQNWQDPRVASHFLQEDEVVGIEGPRDELIKRLVEGEPQLTVISVLGMGGLGKTTLVKKIYDKPQIQSYFECDAWITISHSFDVEDLLRDMMKQFFDARKNPTPEGINSMKYVQLMKIIKDYLQEKRYVAILDDIWKIEAWENIFKYVFPDCKNGSRIMVTTRMAEVASSCVRPHGHVHNLQPLNEEKAWTLFCKKAFGLKHMGSCPPELKVISHHILKRCGGLPLAIITIGGVLSKKETEPREWQKLHDNLSSEMENNPSLIGMRKILELSYNDLPYYLKSCLLYLSLFPEDYSIKSKRLIRFWTAEGFVDPKERSTVEEVAISYLIELMDRSLIQSTTLRKRWQTFTELLPRRISVHDLTRDIIVLKSKEENFSTFIEKNDKRIQEKIHRLCIRESGESVTEAEGLLQTRCLILFRKGGACDSLYEDAFFSKFKLLRVLDLKGAPLENFPSKIGELFHLRFLSLRRTNIKTVPKSIGKLKKLEVLDLKQTYITQLPQEILNLTNLRILFVYLYKLVFSFPYVQGVHLPTGIANLISLEKLAFVDVGHDIEMVKAMGKLTHLKRLGIINLKSIDGEIMCVSIEKMKELSTLDIRSSTDEEVLNLHSLACPQRLQHVYLKGRLEKIPGWITSQQSLARVSLMWCRLRDDPLKALQALPNLVHLSLYAASYDGEELRCEEGTFPKLKVLSLIEMDKLNTVTLGERAMGGLQYLDIGWCPEMKTLPLGIESLTNLKELCLFHMSDKLVEGLRKDEGSDHWKIKHIPIVQHFYEMNGQSYCENLI